MVFLFRSTSITTGASTFNDRKINRGQCRTGHFSFSLRRKSAHHRQYAWIACRLRPPACGPRHRRCGHKAHFLVEHSTTLAGSQPQQSKHRIRIAVRSVKTINLFTPCESRIIARYLVIVVMPIHQARTWQSLPAVLPVPAMFQVWFAHLPTTNISGCN